MSDNELSLWEALKKTLKPLKKNRAAEPVPFPKRLRVHAPPARELLSTLDLHGLTVQEAYRVFCRFITLHVRNKSRVITIITGKGTKEKEGLIHHEVLNWIENRTIRPHINQVRWLNGGGALEIRLKKQK